MPRISLFGSRLSPFVEKVALALALKRLDFELIAPRGPADLRRWNPQARKMPVLEIDGDRVYDSTFIARRLDALVPDPPLLSADAPAAAAQRLLEDWCDESLYWQVLALRWSRPRAAADALLAAVPLPALLRPLVRCVARRRLRAAARAQGLGRLPRPTLLAELAQRLDDLVAVLGDAPFFYGERPSIADLALAGQLRFAAVGGVIPEWDGLLGARAPLVAWQQRVAQHTGG
jgi:glutathione S-transferase